MAIVSTCRSCDDEFEHYPSEGGEFCSRECYLGWNRGRNHPQWEEKVSYKIDGNGYPAWHDNREGDDLWVKVHRLLAVAEFGFDTVSEGDVVHHRNREPWDNSPDNIEVMSRGEHTAKHNKS